MSHKQRTKQAARIRRRINERTQVEKRSLFNDLISFVLPRGELFSKEQFHGNTKWVPEELATQALIWSWQDTQKVTDAFEKTLEICQGLGLKNIAKTYTGFMNAISENRETLRTGLRIRLQALAERVGGRFFRDRGWVLMGFDGSRATAPRSIANERAFCAPNIGSGKTSKYRKKKSKGLRRKRNAAAKVEAQEPQVWITMMWHMGLRLPWTWRIGPSNSSERAHVEEMLEQEEMPEDTLYCADAGFIGYPFWESILDAGGHFLVRVGGNVHLLREQADVQEAEDGTVLCWPKDQMQSGNPPLRLRLVHITVGKTAMWLLTSVLDEEELTLTQIEKYYKLRWLIEVEFRGLKQTIDKSKLRCRNCKRLLAELDWSMYGMAFAELVGLRAQIPQSKTSKPTYTPRSRSLANILRVMRRYMRNLNQRVNSNALAEALAKAVVQRYNNRTDKRARYRPYNPDKKPLGDPIIRDMTPKEIRKLEKIQLAQAA